MDISFLKGIPGIGGLIATAMEPAYNGLVGAINGDGNKTSQGASRMGGSNSVSSRSAPIQQSVTSGLAFDKSKYPNLPDSILRALGNAVSAYNKATQPTTAAQTNETATTGNKTQTNPTRLTAADPSNSTNASTQMRDGQAVFENDNYIITAGDNNTVSIYNKKTKEVYEAVGDTGMKIDGKQGFSLTGTTSLMLNDGTKITLGKADDGKGGSVASKLTITNGAYGSQIIGIDKSKEGGLAVKEFQGQGEALDQQVNDGVTLSENQNINVANGRGFSVSDINGAETEVNFDYLSKVDRGINQDTNLSQFDDLTDPTTTAVQVVTAAIPTASTTPFFTPGTASRVAPSGCFGGAAYKPKRPKQRESQPENGPQNRQENRQEVLPNRSKQRPNERSNMQRLPSRMIPNQPRLLPQPANQNQQRESVYQNNNNNIALLSQANNNKKSLATISMRV